MRVAIDARSVQSKMQGVGRYVLNLLLGLSHRPSDLEFLVLYSNPFPIKVIERSGGAYRGRFQWIKTSSSSSTVVEALELPWVFKMNRVQLFHTSASAPAWSAGVPTILTVHELAALHQGDHDALERIRKSIKKSKLVISVSESLADEVEATFRISRPKVRVIPNAIDPWYNGRATQDEIRAARERFKLPGKFFLCVTADRPAKNLKLAKSVASAWEGDEQWVFTVPDSGDKERSSREKNLGIVEDVWLRSLYAACSAVVVPSLYEGFSLPPIEALASGTIPVVSDIAAHREVLSSYLPRQLFFDPHSEDSLKQALRSVIEGGDSLRASVLENFRSVRDRYSAIETATRVQNVYREALN